MRYFIILLLAAMTTRAGAQDMKSYKIDNLVMRISNPDTLYIVNFWATWCGPCVKELSEFNILRERYADKPVKVLMVSLDFREAYPDKIASFVRKKKLQPEVVWLDETDANIFIPRIGTEWQGSIPATLILYGKKEYRNFFEGMITADRLSTLIDRQLAF